MRILLVSEQAADFQLLESLCTELNQPGVELSWCKAELAALRAINLRLFQLVIWGQVQTLSLSRQLLAELYRQHPGIPVILLTDNLPQATDLSSEADDSQTATSLDILLRNSLSVDALRHSIEFVGMRPAATDQLLDPLTGLGNRQQFREQMARLLALGSRPDAIGLLLIDVDQFKKVNASYGQGAGDALIQLIAERIRSQLSAYQQLTRIGGNEFAVILQNATTSVEAEARQRCEKIIQAMAKPFPVAQHAVKMTLSIGIAMNSASSITVDNILANADMAMRIAKQESGSNFQFYTHDMTNAAQKILKLEAEIRQGIRREEFELYYQPRIDIKQNRIVGAEALIRWNHPARGLLAPSQFIAVAEESGLIVPLGYWVIHSACKHLNELASKGHVDVQIAVNVAFKQFQDRNFVATVANILDKHGISPGRLEFELTETTMMIEGHAVDRSLRQLSELGIDISLDDFGTGYSSFAHIQRLPISALKIDRSFINSVSSNEDDATIVKALINLAHSLSMQVIAEGAETPEQLEFLCLNECDQVQGFYFSKAIDFSSLKVLLIDETFVDKHIQAMIDNSARSS
ncbi:MAG: bifunctional diguanylate cyclase/phosphodiesterase [Pseudomonadales bacterium]|nr:bifunctional diguanylate cyclase/phosphodiesterase [Pseudomonadales bacterium]